jgi:hypothetical protein
MKKIISTLLLIVLMVSLTACGGESAEKATINTIEAVKTYNKEALSKYLDYNKLLNINESGNDSEGEEYIKNIFKNMEYKITSSKENGDTAVVSAEITNVDMSNVLTLYVQEAMSIAMAQAFSEEAQTEEEMKEQMNQLLVNIIEENKATTATNNVDINLIKVDKQWKVEIDENLQNALMGNMLTASNMFGE